MKREVGHPASLFWFLFSTFVGNDSLLGGLIEVFILNRHIHICLCLIFD